MKKTNKKIPLILDNEFKPSMSEISKMLDWADNDTHAPPSFSARIQEHLFGLLDCYKVFKKLIKKQNETK